MNKLTKPIKIRSDSEGHRQATWLELFIDLVYVIGIASLSHIFKDGFTFVTITKFSISFFLIFWIWNRFTWYATYYDNDDTIFRIAYLVSLFPTLGFVHSLEKAYEGDFAYALYFYIGINLVLIFLWARVWVKAKAFRKNATYFTLGYILSSAVIMIACFVSSPYNYIFIGAAMICEAIAPILGWYKENTKLPVHTSHIVERHGLFSIILLGEGVVSISKNFKLIHTEHWYLLLCGFLIVIASWWIYFDCGLGFKTQLSKKMNRVFIFGYGHFLVFLSLIFIGIGLEFTLHHYLENSVTIGVQPAKVVGLSIGIFLVLLSAVQMIVSNLNPSRIYYRRLIVAVLLISVSLYINNVTILIIITTLLTLLVLINEILIWPKILFSSK